MSEEQKVIKRRNTPTALAKIIKSLDAAAKGAVEGLVSLSTSMDEKIKLEACKAILSLRDDMQDKAEKRELQFMLVNFKTGGGLKREDGADEVEFDENELQQIT